MGVLDLVGLAVDVHQSTQVYQAREQLKRIEMGVFQESARRQVLESLRHFVFIIGQNLKTLDQYLETAPQTVYVAAKTLAWRFQDIGIDPGIFPEFSDKEYVQQVRNKLDVMAQASDQKLSSEQKQEAEACFRAVVEMPYLNQAIEARTAITHLQETDSEWKHLSKRKRFLMIAGFAGIISSCPIWMAFVLASRFLDRGLPVLWLTGGLIAMLVGAVGSVLILISLLILGRNKTYLNLEEMRKAWQKQVPPHETMQWYEVNFGDQRTDYSNLRAQRQQLIQSVMGQIEGYSKLLSR